MKINNFAKNIIITSMAFGAMVLNGTTSSKAVLQSNGNTGATYNLSDWMINVRKMEELGGAMGLSETLNSNLISSSDSNNIDVHMMRTTEYGAIAILSASGYGNSKTLQNSSIKTTTGNKTGVYFTGTTWEWNAGGLQGYIFRGVNAKYYDSYTGSSSSAKVGDAIGCRGWHSASTSNWVTENNPYFARDNGGLFSIDDDDNGVAYAGRGVAVCGAGL